MEYSDVFVENDLGKILFLLRSEDDKVEPMKYSLPGGKVDKGEDIEDAAIRELSEETGIFADKLQFITSVTNDDDSVTNYYKYHLSDSDNIVLSDEHEGYKWVNPEDMDVLDDVIFDNNDRFVEVYDSIEA